MSSPKNNKESKPKLRKSVYLVQYNVEEIEKLLLQYEYDLQTELIDHLYKVFGEIEEYYKTGDDAVYERYRLRENELIKKYQKSLKPFADRQFYKLFDSKTVLVEKEYYTADEFNALGTSQENQLSELDIRQWTETMQRYLLQTLNLLHLHGEIYPDGVKSLSGANEPDKEMTEARRVLAVYFLLKAGFNVDPHNTNNAHSFVAITRLVHLLFGKPFTTAQNSSVYTKYKKMPEYNSGTVLVKDLRYIRQFFVDLDMKNVVELIDEQIKFASRK